MKNNHVRPSCHARLDEVTPEVPEPIRQMTTREIIAAIQPLPPDLVRQLTYRTDAHARIQIALRNELTIRLQMASELLDPNDPDLGMHAQAGEPPRSDLSVARHDVVPAEADDSARCYGAEDGDLYAPAWYVTCRKDAWPWRGTLPLAFATPEQAEAARQALERSGLGTYAALHKRIKVELDWEGVKCLMRTAVEA